MRGNSLTSKITSIPQELRKFTTNTQSLQLNLLALPLLFIRCIPARATGARLASKSHPPPASGNLPSGKRKRLVFTGPQCARRRNHRLTRNPRAGSLRQNSLMKQFTAENSPAARGNWALPRRSPPRFSPGRRPGPPSRISTCARPAFSTQTGFSACGRCRSRPCPSRG